jgi:hypothetical protein
MSAPWCAVARNRIIRTLAVTDLNRMSADMAKQTNRVGVRLLGLIDGVAEGPWGIAAFVLITLSALLMIYAR